MALPKVFICYAHEDQEWLARLLQQLGPLQRLKRVEVWCDRTLQPGDDWHAHIQRSLKEAKVAVLLVSGAFLNSEYIANHELPVLLKRAKDEGVVIVPIVLKPCLFEETLFKYPDPQVGPESFSLADLQGANSPSEPLTKLPEWQQDEILVAVARRVIALVAPPEDPLAGGVTAVLEPGALWNVPFERNVFFTGRSDALATLRRQLTGEQQAVVSQGAAVCGLGGIGKTQTAVEYAYRYREDYGAVFWVRSETETELIGGYVAIAQVLSLPQQDAQDPQDAVVAVQRWLAERDDWLLIFDNVDDVGLLQKYQPKSVRGHVLLTSRAQNFTALGIREPIVLERLPEVDAVFFLQARTERQALPEDEAAAVVRLAKALDYFPLALEQSAAYIREKQARFGDYLASYERRRLALLEQAGPETGAYPASVATTWELNFQQLEDESRAAADLLRVSAFLSPDAIPYELITGGAEYLGEAIATALVDAEADPVVVNELLAPLARYSLIRLEPNGQTYSIYRLVQEVIRAKLTADDYRGCLERGIEAVTQVFPNSEYGNWRECDRILSHAQTIADVSAQFPLRTETLALLIGRTVLHLNARVQYVQAEVSCIQALKMRKQLLGNEHPSVALSLNNLASLYNKQGRYEKAEPLYLEALKMRKQLLGDGHLSVALSLNNLAYLYDKQGRNKEAEPLYIRALQMMKRLLGNENLSVASSLNNLASLYNKQKRYEDAKPLYVEALKMRKRLRGNEHPDVALSLNNLASLYDNQGRYEKAEPLYIEALQMRKRLLGNEHPDVARSLNNLASFYDNQGRYEKVEPLYVEALRMRKRLLGNEHPDVASSLNNLAYLYNKQGRYEEAEPLYVEAVRQLERFLGSQHPNTKIVRNNLEICRRNQ